MCVCVCVCVHMGCCVQVARVGGRVHRWPELGTVWVGEQVGTVCMGWGG